MKLATMLATMAAAMITCAALAQEAAEFGKPISEGGGIKVYAKVDFDSANPFKAQDNGQVVVEDKAGFVCAGKSLHVSRSKPESYWGAGIPLEIAGATDLKFGFCIRAKGMKTVTMNAYDAVKKDNTTPTSPAVVFDNQWRTVVMYAKDFHFNSDPPQKKIPANVKYTGMFFHGEEVEKGKGEYWIDRFVIYRGTDTQAPTAPGNLKAVDDRSGKAALTWDESTDNAFPAVYSIYRKDSKGGWEKVGESVQCHFTDDSRASGKLTYRVTAADYENNISEPSKDAEVTVIALPAVVLPPTPPTDQVADRTAYADNVRKIHDSGKDKVVRDVIVFCGDSITAADNYTHLLIGWLGRGITVRQGVGMITTAYGKDHIDKYLADGKPEYAVVMYGTNNGKDEKSVATAVEDMTSIIDSCVKAGTVPIIATIPPKGFDKAKQDGQARYNEAIVKLCREKKCPISYAYQEMMKAEDLKKILGDGTHLNDGGNNAAGAALLKTYDQIGWVLRDTSGTMK